MARPQIDFALGTEFRDLETFRKRLSENEKQGNVNFAVASSNLLRANNEVSLENVTDLHYKYARFESKMYGNPRATVAEDNLVRTTESYKQICEASFTVGARKNAHENVFFLRILSFKDEHNHTRSKNVVQSMPKQRNEVVNENADYLKKVVNVAPSYQLLQNQISSKFQTWSRTRIGFVWSQ